MEEISVLLKSYIAHPAGAAFLVIIMLWIVNNEQRRWLAELDSDHEFQLSKSDRKEEYLRYMAKLMKRQLYFTNGIFLIVTGGITWLLIMFLADQ